MAKDKPAKESMDGVITDKRFSRLHSDPRFMRLPRNKFKVQIDSRFQGMFSDKKFSESLAVDKRGKPKKKKDKNKLLEYYYHQDQEEEEQEDEEENVNKHTLKNNEDNPDEDNGEMGTMSRVNSFDKTRKKKNKSDGKLGNFHTVCGDDHVVSDDFNLSNVTGISDSHMKENKKNKKKERETVENSGSFGKTTDGGDDEIQEMQLMKMERKKKKKIQGIQLTRTKAKELNKTSDKLFDSNEVVHAETCTKKRGLGSIKKKKKKRNESKLVDLDENLYTDEGANGKRPVGSFKDETKEISSGLDESMFIEEAQENNRDVKLKNKKKKKNANNDLDDSDRKNYTFKNGLGIQGLEQFKGDHEQVRTQPEVSVDLGGYKANSNLSEKLKCKGRLKGSRKNLNAIDASNFAKRSQTKTESEDDEKQIEKRSSMFESEKKENNTVEGFLGKHHESEEDQELSEPTSSSGKDVDISESEESETSTSSDDDEADYQIETDYLEEEKVPTVDSETRRLAAVNMDWNHIKAVDLLVMMNSFLPKGGHILSVAVYPSEFGLKQMEEEAVRGPALFGSDDESDEDDESEIDNEKLRQYEKARLRYYYAVIDCDSSATADYLYKACDGAEFERTSNVMDLRFIPDDMELNHPPRDVATEVPIGYEAPEFHTRALQHSRVNVSWDDDEPLRVKTLNRKYDPKQLNEMDFKAYLASDDGVSDSDEDEEVEDGVDNEKKKDLREKYRSLLLDSGDPSEGREDKDDKDMEITFNTGLEKLSKQILERKNKNNSEETVWEAYLRKRSEKRKARKNITTKSSEEETGSSDGEDASNIDWDNQSDDFFLDDDSGDNVEKIITGSKIEKAAKKNSKSKALSSEIKSEEDASKAELELLLADDHGLENSVRGYNLKSIKSKYQKVKESAIEDKLPTVDTDDPRFSALFTSHHFAIDPTNPQFKRSATYSRSIVQKQQKKFADKTMDDLKSIVQKESIVDDSSTKKRKTELSSLVKSVKRKVGTLQS